ncbi:MAG TPA: hypothetical protein VNW95_03340 [Mucilaginibacter sp.]|nr:hypothetical protein [Mucilaginibacter sp.]
MKGVHSLWSIVHSNLKPEDAAVSYYGQSTWCMDKKSMNHEL